MRDRVLSMKFAKCQHAIVSRNHFRKHKEVGSNTKTNLFPQIALKGWSSWSEWSPCNDDGERIRYRKCVTTNPGVDECQGNERDIRSCIPQPNG